MPNWPFVFSCVTAATAVAALFFSGWQIKQANKQSLLQRRMRLLIIARGLQELYREHQSLFERKADGPEFADDFMFACMTNNAYLCDIAPVINHVLDQNKQQAFLKKLEELKENSLEARLLFKGEPGQLLSSFIDDYRALLFAMYQYQIMLNKLSETSKQFQMNLEEAIENVGEEVQRNNLYDVEKRLSTSYDALQKKRVAIKIEKQCRLW